jgi:hypothetical protein
MAKTTQQTEKTTLDTEAWSRFERAVDVVAKSPPQHRVKDNKSPKAKQKISKPTESR